MIEQEKTRLRRIFHQKRLALTPEKVAQKSEEICQNFITNLLPKIYLGCEHEILKQAQDDANRDQSSRHLLHHPELVLGSGDQDADTSNKIFSLYLASSNEASPDVLSEFFQKHQIRFSYPKIIQKNQPLEFILSKKDSHFAANKFYPRILEPIDGKKVIPDFLILPLLAFDIDLSRLGMGGGFFDRSIAQLKIAKSKILTIGLAYDFQRARETLPIANTDQKLDFVVTEKNIFARS